MNDQAQLVVEETRAAMLARGQEIADELIGTPKSLHDVMSDAEYEDSKLLEAVYDLGVRMRLLRLVDIDR